MDTWANGTVKAFQSNSEINEVHTAYLGDTYAHVARCLREANPHRRKSYEPYEGKVFELIYNEKSIKFQSECLLPENDRGRPRVLLLFSNAHPKSIENGIFHTAEGKVAALWDDLLHVGLFSGNRTILKSAHTLRSHCLNIQYDGPFAFGFACYWIFPTFNPDHLRPLFGPEMEPPGFENPNRRLDRVLAKWQPTAIISFNGKVFQALTGINIEGYINTLREGLIRADYQAAGQMYPVFQTYPASWHYSRGGPQLRRDSLRRIANIILDASNQH